MNNGSKPQSSATGIENFPPTIMSESANTIEMGAPMESLTVELRNIW